MGEPKVWVEGGDAAGDVDVNMEPGGKEPALCDVAGCAIHHGGRAVFIFFAAYIASRVRWCWRCIFFYSKYFNPLLRLTSRLDHGTRGV